MAFLMPNATQHNEDFRLSQPGTWVVPKDADVILGRGTAPFHHSGNSAMRRLVQEYVPAYRTAEFKSTKTYIVSEIYARLRRQGRRFIQTASDGECTVTSHKRAKAKIAHAMRYLIQQLHERETTHLFTDDELESVLGPDGFFKLASWNEYYEHEYDNGESMMGMENQYSYWGALDTMV